MKIEIGPDGLGREQNPFNMYEGNLNPLWLPLFIAHEIYKRHGDIHNLIGRGLAIDKTLIDKKI